MIDNWYQMSGDKTAEKLKTSKTDGLTRKAARAALRKYGKNEIYPVSKITFFNVLKAMTLDYTSYLLIATALIAAIFEESVGAWILIILVTLNLIATLLAYAKSQRILEGMDRYTLPVVRVIRDGRLFMIDQKQLVPGDLICVSRGDIVPADARLMTSRDLCVDEERLFGRGPLHYKTADVELHETLQPQQQKNMIFAGTLVTSGEATAIVTATGDAAIIAVTEKNHPIISHESMPLLGRLQKISRAWSLVVIAAVFILTLVDFMMPGQNNALFSSFIGAMSFAVSTMSEMYVAFGYIILACSVYQTVQLFRDAGGSGAILKNPLCMDKLRTMTALVVPKEGIFTTRESVADRIFAEDRLYDITDRRGRRAMERPILYAILSTGMYGEKYLQSLSDHTVRLTRTEEETSILNLARRMDIYNVRLDRAYPLLDHRGVGGESEFETSLVKHKEELIAVSRGECELLLSRCSYYYKNGRIMMLTPEIRTGILIAYRKLVRQTYSVVAMASHTYQYNNLKFVGAAQRDMVFEGFVAFRVPYLRGIGQLVEDAQEAGIKVILTTERPAASEVYFAKQIGILDKKEQAVDGSTLRKMKEGIRRTNASYFRLYCGLDTAQKQELLTYLHEQGEVVGVVGRRLEDLCLLRAADVSFAQNITVRQDKSAIGRQDTVISKVSDSTGEDGCEALKFESDVIVSDAQVKGGGGFRAILDTIGIAKNTDMNVIRIIKYLICAQTARFLLVFYTILFSKDGMGAVQALFAGLFADFLSVMIIAFQKPSPDVLRTAGDAEPWLTHPLRMGIPQIITGVCWACTAILASFFAGLFGFAGTELAQGSVLYVTSMLISIFMLFSQQREDFLWRPGVRMSALHTIYLLALVELFLLFFLFPTFGTMFGVASFAPPALLIIGVLAVVELVLAECIKMLARMRERPDLQGEDEETAERHMQIAALFHLFRAQKAQEDAALHAQVRDEGNTAAAAADNGDTVGDAGEPDAGAVASGRKSEKKPLFAWMRRPTTTDAPSDPAAVSLAEMEEYVNAMRQKDAEKRAESAATDGKKVRFAFGKKSGLKRTPQQSSGFFAEEDADFTPAEAVTLTEDDALLAALRADGSPAEAMPPVFAAAGQDENAQTAAFSQKAAEAGADMLPDQEAYEAALAHIADGPATRDITIGGTDAEVRTFLRTALREDDGKTAEDADREFLGIGYLFSEEEYEAIMAEYNADGTQNAVYNTETQKFDIVGEKPE